MLEQIVTIAKDAGKVIREGFKENYNIEYKTDETNLVTDIDKKSEELIIKFIRENYPEHSILAEESGETNPGAEYLWVIDPIDGTTNFAHGLPLFCVSIGVQQNGVTKYGVIYDVMRDKVFSAEKDKGAFCNGNKIEVRKNEKLIRSLLVTGFPYEMEERLDSAVDLFKKFLKQARAVRRLGSAALDLCFVAEGVFDGFWEEKLNAWDVCAGMLIVEEAGGVITDFEGKPTDIYSKQILATSKSIHDKMLEVIND